MTAGAARCQSLEEIRFMSSVVLATALCRNQRSLESSTEVVTFDPSQYFKKRRTESSVLLRVTLETFAALSIT